MARGKGVRLTESEIQKILDEKTKGLYTYIPDSKFPYTGERSLIVLRDNESGTYLTRSLYYIRYQMKEKWFRIKK